MREAEVSPHRIGPSRLLTQAKVRHDTLLGGQIFRTALKDIKVRAMILRVSYELIVGEREVDYGLVWQKGIGSHGKFKCGAAA